MKHLITFLLSLCSIMGVAQTVTNPPSGSKPYGTPVAAPSGEVLVGRNGSYTYITRTAYTDSLNTNIVDSLLKVQELDDIESLWFDGYAPSLIDTAHTQNEGFMVTVPNGDIHHYFYWSEAPFYERENGGYVARRISHDGGLTWEATEKIIDDPTYSLRNPEGGILASGRVVIWFRRFDFTAGDPVSGNLGVGYIFSINSTYTAWSSPTYITPLDESGRTLGYGNIVQLANGDYLKMVGGLNTAEVFTSSNNGATWQSQGFAWDYSGGGPVETINEVDVAYIGDNRLIALARDLNGDHSYYQFQSNNNGATWTYAGQTNINNGNFGQSPRIYYDADRDMVITFGSERSGSETTFAKDKLRVYANRPNEIFGNPDGYRQVKEYHRPVPSVVRFYGYPTMTKRTNGDYLVVFSEDWINPGFGNSGANLRQSMYQFTIKSVPTYFTQNIPSEYGLDNYQFNEYNGKYEPTPNTSLANIPSGGQTLYADDLVLKNITLRRLGILAYNTDDEPMINLRAASSNHSRGAKIDFKKTRQFLDGATSGSQTINDTLGTLRFFGANDAGAFKPGAQILAVQSGSIGSAENTPSSLIFRTSTLSSGPADRFTLESSGHAIFNNSNSPVATFTRAGSSSNTAIRLTNDASSVYYGIGSANTFAVGTSANLAGSNLFSVSSSGAVFAGNVTTVPATSGGHAVTLGQLSDSLPTNYVTDNTNQSAIGGDKTWIGMHKWSGPTSVNAIYERVGTDQNNVIGFETDGYDRFFGINNGDFRFGPTANVNGAYWAEVNENGVEAPSFSTTGGTLIDAGVSTDNVTATGAIQAGSISTSGNASITGTVSAANINELPTRSLNTSLGDVIAGQTLTYTTTYTGVSSGDVIAVGVSGSIGATDLIITASSTSTAGQAIVKFYNPTGSDIPIGNISIKLKAFK